MGEIPLFVFMFPAGLLVGFILDLIIGDPVGLPHPIIGIGHLISKTEKLLRRLLPGKERLAGKLLVIIVILVVLVLTAGLLVLTWIITPWLTFAVCCILSWQTLSARCLQQETMKVYWQVDQGDLAAARYAVSMIVGRDTAELSMEQVIKASVETVAENTSDGVTGPMLYLAIGGPILGMVYKAINTMDSMVGYKNDKYLDFGRAAAMTDDFVNFIPSRITAIAMILASYLLGFDGKNANRIYWRDRKNHASPNSAQTESVCAGALQIQLAGDATYFSKLYKKPFIGDAIKPICAQNIRASIKLMYGTSVILLPIVCAIGTLVSWGIWTILK
jgi:adenosylcobinamide-phosphate synthase